MDLYIYNGKKTAKHYFENYSCAVDQAGQKSISIQVQARTLKSRFDTWINDSATRISRIKTKCKEVLYDGCSM